MLALYDFEIYHCKGKENLTDLSSCRPDYVMKDDVKEEEKNPLRNLILRRVRFKDSLAADHSEEEEF